MAANTPTTPPVPEPPNSAPPSGGGGRRRFRNFFKSHAPAVVPSTGSGANAQVAQNGTQNTGTIPQSAGVSPVQPATPALPVAVAQANAGNGNRAVGTGTETYHAIDSTGRLKPGWSFGQALTSTPLPVQSSASVPTLPVQAKLALVKNKGVTAANACTGTTQMPVQANNAIPDRLDDLTGWKFDTGKPPLPVGFVPVPHLRSELTKIVVDDDGQPRSVTDVVTGWQIQYGTKCATCAERYRPVAGFITPRVWRRMQKESDIEQQKTVQKIIRGRFAEGRVGVRHPGCDAELGGSVRRLA